MTLPLRVVQATAWYPPYGIGGTETYVEGLVGGLSRRGVESRILLPRPLGAPPQYEHLGVAADTYYVNEIPNRGEARGAPHDRFEDFVDFVSLLKARPSEIYHQHSWTRGLGLAHLYAARRLGLRTVLTIHVASNMCLRGTMVRYGATQCDGLITAQRCGSVGWERPCAHVPSLRVNGKNSKR
jgi:glycosyltransferase involved in cell wall biosynthesis